MLGLMIKDVYAIKRQIKIFIIIMLAYVVFSITTNNFGFLSFVAIFANLGIVFSTIANDEKCNWEKYSRVLPISYQNMVLVRYIEISIINIALFAILIPISAFAKKPEEDFLMVISILAVILSVGIILMSILLPIIFKIGIEKARIIIFIIIFIPVCLMTSLEKLDINLDGTKLLENQIVDFTVHHLYIIVPVLSFIILYLSYLLSVKVVSKKEY